MSKRCWICWKTMPLEHPITNEGFNTAFDVVPLFEDRDFRRPGDRTLDADVPPICAITPTAVCRP